MRSSERMSYDHGASKNKYVVYSQVNRMPLFALEQIVLLSFAERERCEADARPSHVYAKDRNVCDMKTRGTTREEQRRSRSSRFSPVPFPVCFAPLLVMLGASSCTLIPTLITGADTMADTTREDATNSWRCNRDPRTDSRIASGDS